MTSLPCNYSYKNWRKGTLTSYILASREWLLLATSNLLRSCFILNFGRAKLSLNFAPTGSNISIMPLQCHRWRKFTVPDFYWTIKTEHSWCTQMQHVKCCSVAQCFKFSDYNAAHCVKILFLVKLNNCFVWFTSIWSYNWHNSIHKS
jgi:hypothetical protein